MSFSVYNTVSAYDAVVSQYVINSPTGAGGGSTGPTGPTGPMGLTGPTGPSSTGSTSAFYNIQSVFTVLPIFNVSGLNLCNLLGRVISFSVPFSMKKFVFNFSGYNGLLVAQNLGNTYLTIYENDVELPNTHTTVNVIFPADGAFSYVLECTLTGTTTPNSKLQWGVVTTVGNTLDVLVSSSFNGQIA